MAGLILGVLTACQASEPLMETSQAVATTTLIPYHSATPTPMLSTPTPPEPTNAPLPSPTPTYRVHVIEKGDDLVGIAYIYQVTLTDLLAVNPDVNPYAMSVGISLNIPPASPTVDNEEIQPTPVGVQLEQPLCFPSEAQGTWCFSEAYNPLDTAIENVTATLRILPVGQENQQSYAMFPGLNTIPPQGRLPLMAYLPDAVGENYAVSVELNSALPLRTDTIRYLPVSLAAVETQTVSRATMNASGNVVLSPEAAQSAHLVWILGVAYNQDDQIIGVRRLEINTQLEPGAQVPFSFDVYSTGENIARVALSAEAMP
jgi:LysM repeat protein